MREPFAWNAYLAEAVGTFLFLFIGIGAGYALVGEAGGAVLLVVALAHGLALAVMVSAFGAVSGGHFNPAVTFGVWLAGKIDSVKAAGYIVVQLIAAVVAAALAFWVFDLREGIEPIQAVPALGDGIDVLRGIIVEGVTTMVLVTAVFGTALDHRAARIGGLAIGLALVAGILMAGPLTGGSINPARWFGPALIAGDFSNLLVWIVGPLLGGAIVAVIYRVLILPEAERAEPPTTLIDVPEREG